MIRLGPLDGSHVAAHNAGEDAEVIRWLTGRAATEDSTQRHFAMLARNAERRAGKRGFGIWFHGRLAGYIDFDADAERMPDPGDVSLAYFVHSWARGQGVATAAVNSVCELIKHQRIGTRAIIRTEFGNAASAAVAARCGFEQIHVDPQPDDDEPTAYRTWARSLAD